MFQFEGKVAVITGAASGFGRAFAQKGASLGMKLVLADVNPDALAQTVDALRADGAEAIGVPTDVSDRGSGRSARASGARRVRQGASAVQQCGRRLGRLSLGKLGERLGVGVQRQRDGRRARRAGLHADHAAAERARAYRQHGVGGGFAVAARDGHLQRVEACGGVADGNAVSRSATGAGGIRREGRGSGAPGRLFAAVSGIRADRHRRRRARAAALLRNDSGRPARRSPRASNCNARCSRAN